MKNYLQYFNVEKMGRFPNGAEGLFTQRMGVFTKLASVKDAQGSQVYVIAGLGKPKQYYLWEVFTIEGVEHDGEQYTVSGPGWVLLPPQLLKGDDFEKFKAACANFIGFRAIDDQPYCKTLAQVAEQFRPGEPDKSCVAFCDGLVKSLPKMGDAYYYRGTVRKQLGDLGGAREDFDKAVALGTNFPQEAQVALSEPAAAAAKPDAGPKAGGKKGMAAQVVSKGLYAGEAKKPKGVAEVAWRGVVQRRGPEQLREALLKAYGGRCSISNYDTEEALEVALLTGDPVAGPLEVSNALLLRSDLRVLFDLNLLRINPVTRKVFLAGELMKTRHGKYYARRLRLPENKEDWPSKEALEERWKVSGGPFEPKPKKVTKGGGGEADE